MLGIAAAALTLSACSQDDVISNVENNVNNDAIGFTAESKLTSRAMESYCNTNLPGKFKVWAAEEGASQYYIDGMEVTKTGTNPVAYSPADTYFWGEHALNFHAQVNGDANYGYAEDGTPMFQGFAPADDAASQLDLLYAVKKNVYRQQVALNFRHALSQIVFRAVNNASYDVVISEVAVGHINSQGDFTFPSVNTEDNYVNHTDAADPNVTLPGQGTWANVAASATKLYTTSFEAVNVTKEGSVLTGVNHTGGVDGSLMLLPQTTVAWNPSETGADFNGAYFRLKVNFVDKNGNILNNIDKKTGKPTEYAVVPVNIAWKQGVRYIYTFIFDDNGNGGYTPDPENPEPVLGGISFSVTTDDFVPADNNDFIWNGEGAVKPIETNVKFEIPAIKYSESATVKNDETAEFTVPADVPTLEGHDFLGWATTENATEATFQAGDKVTLSKDNANVTLYPVWNPQDVEIVISFDTYGEGTIEPLKATVKYGKEATFTLPATIETADESYALEGWLTSAPAKKILELNDDTPEGLMNPGTRNFKASKSMTLYAVYRATEDAIGGGGNVPGIGD